MPGSGAQAPFFSCHRAMAPARTGRAAGGIRQSASGAAKRGMLTNWGDGRSAEKARKPGKRTCDQGLAEPPPESKNRR